MVDDHRILKDIFESGGNGECCTVSNPDLNSPRSHEENSIESVTLSSRKLSDVPSNIIIKCRIKYGNRRNACKGFFLDYCRSTTMHGLRYIFSVHRPLYEKFYWLVFTLISFYFAVAFMLNTYVKWQNSPVILGFDETLVPVHKIPFPTVTICPEIKVEQNFFDFTNVSQRFWDEVQEYKGFHNMGNLTQEELNNFVATLHICDEAVVNRFVPFIPNTVRPDISQTLVDISVTKNETAPVCKWNGHFFLCCNVFSFVATDEGICYQFNGLQSKDIYRNVSYISYDDPEMPDFLNDIDHEVLENITGSWSLENGYMGQGYNSYPQRTVFATASRGFFAFLQAFEHNIEYNCRTFRQGYKIFLNSPESVPLTSGNYIVVPYGQEVLVSVLPQYIIGDKNLREYSIKKRHCVFNDERYLRFFLHYSQINCQTECLANFTIAKCGCAKFWMPKPPEIPVCDVTEIDCYTEAQKELNLLLQNQTLQKTLDPDFQIMCDCMPSCTSLEYNMEISSAFYDLPKTFEAFRENYEHLDFMGSRITVYFKERHFTAIKRSVLFSLTTLIANFGGIFGLFTGFSGLSIIEFIHFFSFRLFYNIRMRRSIKRKLMKENGDHEN